MAQYDDYRGLCKECRKKLFTMAIGQCPECRKQETNLVFKRCATCAQKQNKCSRCDQKLHD